MTIYFQVSALGDAVDEHELSVYESTGESPAKRERLDTSTILVVENDAEIRTRYVPPPPPSEANESNTDKSVRS